MMSFDDALNAVRQLMKADLPELAVALEFASSQANRLNEVDALVGASKAAVEEEKAKLNSVRQDIAKANAELAKVQSDIAAATDTSRKLRETISDLKNKLNSILA